MAKTPDPENTLKAHMRVQRRSDVDVKKVLRDSAVELGKEVTSLGKTLDGARAAAAKVVAHDRLEELYREIENKTAANKQAAASAAVDAFKPYADLMRGRGGRRAVTQLVAGYSDTARVNIAQAEARLLGLSYHALSENIYRSRALSQGWVDRYLDRALVKGLSSAEVAAGLKKMIRPDVPGGVSYAALRTARTEINNAFHAVSIERYREEGVLEVDWNLSESHAVPDECDENAEVVWGINQVPRKPHPTCFCYITPRLPDENDFISGLLGELL